MTSQLSGILHRRSMISQKHQHKRVINLIVILVPHVSQLCDFTQWSFNCTKWIPLKLKLFSFSSLRSNCANCGFSHPNMS